MAAVLLFYFGIPHGAIWPNVVAEPFVVGATLGVTYAFRNRLMKRFVAFHHKHKVAHAAAIEAARAAGKDGHDPGN